MTTSYKEVFVCRSREAAGFDKEMTRRFGTSNSFDWRADALMEQVTDGFTNHIVYSHWIAPKPYSTKYLFAFVHGIGTIFRPLATLTLFLDATFTGDQVDIDYIRSLLAQMYEADFTEEGAIILMTADGFSPKRCKNVADVERFREERGWYNVFEGGSFYRVRMQLIEKWLERKERELASIPAPDSIATRQSSETKAKKEDRRQQVPVSEWVGLLKNLKAYQLKEVAEEMGAFTPGGSKPAKWAGLMLEAQERCYLPRMYNTAKLVRALGEWGVTVNAGSLRTPSTEADGWQEAASEAFETVISRGII